MFSRRALLCLLTLSPCLLVTLSSSSAQDAGPKLTLRWFGQSFFQLETSAGKRVVLKPNLGADNRAGPREIRGDSIGHLNASGFHLSLNFDFLLCLPQASAGQHQPGEPAHRGGGDRS